MVRRVVRKVGNYRIHGKRIIKIKTLKNIFFEKSSTATQGIPATQIEKAYQKELKQIDIGKTELLKQMMEAEQKRGEMNEKVGVHDSHNFCLECMPHLVTSFRYYLLSILLPSLSSSLLPPSRNNITKCTISPVTNEVSRSWLYLRTERS